MSRSNQESIALSEGTHAALTPVDQTKKSITQQLSRFTAEYLGLQEVQNGGLQTGKKIKDGGGDRLCNSNSEQHV